MNCWALPLFLLAAGACSASPENLAPRATVSASSEYSADYAARYATDGKIPEAGSQDDLRQAWCVQGATANGQGEFVLEWPEPVTVAAVVIFARTGWLMEDCFKDCEVYLDAATAPVAKAALRMIHGPQQIELPQQTVRKLRLKFLSSHGGPNPGASEIAVYSAIPSKRELDRFLSPDTALKDELLAGKLGFSQFLVIKRHPLRTSHVYTYHVDGFVPGGGLYACEPATGTLREIVNAGAGEILDCDLSYDGKEILFSWKREGKPLADVAASGQEHCMANPGENFQVYRIGVDGSGLTQLTDAPCNNLSPRWLPDGGVLFTSDRRPAFAYCWVSSSPVLHRMDRDGSNVRQISFSYLMDFTPCVLNDGRILYTRWEYVDRPAIPIQALWTIRPDGTGVSGFFGNRVLSPATFMQAQPIPGSDAVLCLLTSHNGDPRGAIGIVDPSRGSNAQAGIRNLTPDMNIGRVDQGDGNNVRGPYETPFPIDGRCYLVACNGAIQIRHYDNSERAAIVLNTSDNGMGYYSPLPIRTRAVPLALPRLQVADDQEPWATIFLADVYNGLDPAVKRGELAQICVVEEVAKTTFAPVQSRAFGFQFPLVSCGATYAPKKVWGFADIAADGSAYFKAPSGVPLYFLALDRQGRAVQRMRTFTHFMPGEQQSCAGCHADRNYITATAPRPSSDPVGRALDARREPSASTGLRRAEALQGGPKPLHHPGWGVKGFSYREVVQPVLDRNCVQCHNARSAPCGVDLSGDTTDFFNVSYEILARQGTWGEKNFMAGGISAASAGRNPYTDWIPTINGTEHSILNVTPKTFGSPASKLADLIIAGHPDADGKPRVQLDAESRQRIMTWIDLNVPYYPTSSSGDLRATGCRRIYPAGLDAELGRVATARCAGCHAQGIPRKFFTRIEKPELNSFLLAPLAKAAGGTEACGKAVFANAGDPDFQAILKTFEPAAEAIRKQPRDDLPRTQSCSASVTPAAVQKDVTL